MTIVSRRNLLFGFGGVVAGGATATFVGLTFRSEIKRFLQPPDPEAKSIRAVDNASEDDGWLITEAERMELESAGLRVSSESLELRASVDLPGGDLRSQRVADLQECVTLCEQDEQCKAFTFARASHPAQTKKRMCWLKTSDAKSEVTGAVHYVSGRRGIW